MSQTDQGQKQTASLGLSSHGVATSSPTHREHWQALLLALVCSVLFLRDGLLPGRALVPHPPELFDVHMAQAKGSGTFDERDVYRGNVGMTDKYLQSLCWDRVMQDRLRQGELPLWTRDIGGGAPFVQQMAQPYQPINVLLLMMPSIEWYGWWYLVHLVLFGWFAYLFLRRVGCLHGAALLGLVAATLGMWTQCKLHHNVILTAALSLWPMLSATHELIAVGVRDAARRRAVGWLALWTGLSWSTGFVVVALQATYMTGAFAMLCALCAERGDRLRRLWPFAIALGIGGVLSLANMLPILLASTESARNGTFDAARLQTLGLEWDHLLSLAWPDLLSWPADQFYPKGGDSLAYDTGLPFTQLVLLEQPLRPEDNSAFQNWVETSFAVGTIPLAAAATAICSRRHRALSWFFFSVALLAFGMATASQPFFDLARIVPGLTSGDLRRLLFSVAMPLVVLSGLGADAWLRGGLRWPGRAALITIAAISSIALFWLWQHGDPQAFVRANAELFVMDADNPEVVRAGGNPELIAQAAKDRAKPGEIENNQAMLWGTAMLSLLVAAAGIAALSRRHRYCVPALLVTTIVELIVSGNGPVQTVSKDRVMTPPKVFAPIATEHKDLAPRPRIQRLVTSGSKSAGLPGNLPGFLGFADANAYNPLPPARYEQFFNCIETGVGHGGAGVGSFRQEQSLSHPLCDLYGIRYIITSAPVATNSKLLDRTPDGTGGFRLIERNTAMERATFVRQVDIIPDSVAPTDAAQRADTPPEQARLDALKDPDRDVRNRVILEDPQAVTPTPSDNVQSEVVITQHADERVEITVTCSHDGYVRLADPYDAGWQATIDGKPTDILIADHYLRAVYVESGEHEIVFTYDGARVVWPMRLSLLALLAVAFCLITGRRHPK